MMKRETTTMEERPGGKPAQPENHAPVTIRPGHKYQVMPPPTPEERAAVKASIERDRCIVPVEIDEEGNIIGGHLRFEIAQELGIPCPFIVIHLPDEAAKRRLAYMLNLAQRHLDPLRWGLAFAGYLAENGVRRGRGRQEAKTATVGVLAKQCGVSERTARDRLALADRFQKLPEFLRANVDPT